MGFSAVYRELTPREDLSGEKIKKFPYVKERLRSRIEN
jgi:hypothetical protein